MSGDSSNPKSQIIDSTHDHLYDRDKLVPVSYSKQMAVRILPSEHHSEQEANYRTCTGRNALKKRGNTNILRPHLWCVSAPDADWSKKQTKATLHRAA